jgi:hypothetical protein
VISALFLLIGGCGAAPKYNYSLPPSQPVPAESLFAGDEAVMRDVDIAKVLDAKVGLPDQVRIAVMRFDDRSRWAWWSEELSRLDADSITGLLGKLRSCPRIADASVLPSMLVPQIRTVPHLRVAAVRYQADLLLIYQVTTRTFERQQFLREKEAKARCLIDVVLLDVRSGIVPFASSTVETFVATPSKGDFSAAETMYQAELAATSRGLDRLAGELVAFLEGVPARTDGQTGEDR